MDKQEKTAAGSIVVIIVVALVAIMGWSYMTDGDFNPFERNVMDAQVGDMGVDVDENLDGSYDVEIDE